MNPVVKRALAAVAIKEIIDRVQEARKPKRGLFGRFASPLVLAAAAGGLYYLYKNGKLDSVIEQGKSLFGQDAGPDSAPPPPAATSTLG